MPETTKEPATLIMLNNSTNLDSLLDLCSDLVQGNITLAMSKARLILANYATLQEQKEKDRVARQAIREEREVLRVARNKKWQETQELFEGTLIRQFRDAGRHLKGNRSRWHQAAYSAKVFGGGVNLTGTAVSRIIEQFAHTCMGRPYPDPPDWEAHRPDPSQVATFIRVIRSTPNAQGQDASQYVARVSKKDN